MSASVFWKDDHERGLKGVVEVHAFELAGGRFEDACIRDLLQVLDSKVGVLGGKDGVWRKVENIDLYGTPLALDQRLDSIITTLAGNSPRLVATTRAIPIHATTMLLRIEPLFGASGDVPGAWSETVSCFKLRIRDTLQIAPEEQILVFEDTKLEDHRTLGSYGLRNGNTVNVMLALSGGFVQSKRFADVSADSILVTQDFNPEAPMWREAYKGLNIEAKCESNSCKAFGKWVIHPVRYEKFNLLLDVSAKCPVCHAKVKPLTCGFYDCVWKFEGVKVSDGNSIISPWKDASGYQYHLFEANETTGCVDWASLLIIAKPRNDANAAKLLISTDSLDRADANPNDTCTICWSKFGLETLKFLFTAPCSHRFHSKCYRKWSEWCTSRDSLPSCPACRKAVQSS